MIEISIGIKPKKEASDLDVWSIRAKFWEAYKAVADVYDLVFIDYKVNTTEENKCS